MRPIPIPIPINLGFHLCFDVGVLSQHWRGAIFATVMNSIRNPNATFLLVGKNVGVLNCAANIFMPCCIINFS